MAEPEKLSRKCYTVSFKLKVVGYAEQHNKLKASQFFGVDRKRVREWCKAKIDLQLSGHKSTRKRALGAGRKVRYQEIDTKLKAWFEEQREKGVRVTEKALKNEALRLCKENGPQSFNASRGWFVSFKKRHGITATVVMPKTRKLLTLNQKYHAILELEKGVPAYKVAEQLKAGKTQIQNLRKRKQEVLSDLEKYAGDCDSFKRKPNITGNEEINTLTLEWLKNLTGQGKPVIKTHIQTQALVFAERLGKNDFKASTGWLSSFLKRHQRELDAVKGGQSDVKDVSEGAKPPKVIPTDKDHADQRPQLGAMTVFTYENPYRTDKQLCLISKDSGKLPAS